MGASSRIIFLILSGVGGFIPQKSNNFITDKVIFLGKVRKLRPGKGIKVMFFFIGGLAL